MDQYGRIQAVPLLFLPADGAERVFAPEDQILPGRKAALHRDLLADEHEFEIAHAVVVEYRELPGLLRLADGRTVSPVTEETFTAYGGVITDDGEISTKEAVVASLNALLHELEAQVNGITVAEFKSAALTMHSGELVAFTRRKGVSEEVIASARLRVMEIMADALREGVTWAELGGGIAAN